MIIIALRIIKLMINFHLIQLLWSRVSGDLYWIACMHGYEASYRLSASLLLERVHKVDIKGSTTKLI